jgi:hypothetical protein
MGITSPINNNVASKVLIIGPGTSITLSEKMPIIAIKMYCPSSPLQRCCRNASIVFAGEIDVSSALMHFVACVVIRRGYLGGGALLEGYMYGAGGHDGLLAERVGKLRKTGFRTPSTGPVLKREKGVRTIVTTNGDCCAGYIVPGVGGRWRVR